jgi:hypothetical protein
MEDKIQKIIDIVHHLREEAIIVGSPGSPPTNSLAYGKIAGTKEAGDDPPVRRKTKKYMSAGRGSRKMWINFLKNK